MLAWVLTAALADPIDGGATVTLRAGLRTWGNEHGRPVAVVAVDPRVAVLVDALRTNTPGLRLRPIADPDAASDCVVTVAGPIGEVWTLRGSDVCPGVRLAGLPPPRDSAYARSHELTIGLWASGLATLLVAAPLLDRQPAYGAAAGWAAGSLAVTLSAPKFARLEAGLGALGSVLLVGGGAVAVAVADPWNRSPWLGLISVLSIPVPALSGHLMVRHARRVRLGAHSGRPTEAPPDSVPGWILETCHLPVAGVEVDWQQVVVQPGAVPTDEIAFCLAAWDRQDSVTDWTSTSAGPDGVVWTRSP